MTGKYFFAVRHTLLYVHINVHTHTHTHTSTLAHAHTYMYMYMYLSSQLNGRQSADVHSTVAATAANPLPALRHKASRGGRRT